MIKPLLAFGTSEIIIIVLIVVLLFGAKKIPELMRGMGRGVKEFKDAVNGDGIVDGPFLLSRNSCYAKHSCQNEKNLFHTHLIFMC